MEKFTVVIKNIYANNKSKNVNIQAEDTWLAHKLANDHYNQLKEDIFLIKDSKGNEVYSIEKGFIFE